MKAENTTKIKYDKDGKILSSFSDFFHYASPEEKKALFLKVIKEANQDQKDLIERYNKLHKTA